MSTAPPRSTPDPPNVVRAKNVNALDLDIVADLPEPNQVAIREVRKIVRRASQELNAIFATEGLSVDVGASVTAVKEMGIVQHHAELALTLPSAKSE